MRKTTLVSVSLCLFIAATSLADVTFEQEAKMGGIMKVLTLGRGMKSVTRISGNRMRTESGEQVQIVDLDQEKIYQLNTKKKTYTVMTFDQMRQQIQRAMAPAKTKAQENKAEQKSPEYSTRGDIKVSDTGKSQEIGGYPCKQYLLQFDLTMRNEETKEEGTLSTVTEAWLTESAPGTAEVDAFYRQMAQKLGTTELGRQMLASQGKQSSQFASGMQQMGSELKKMKGFAMRTVFYFGSPEAAAAEAQKGATAEESPGEKKKKGGLGGFLKRSLPGAGNDQDQEEEGESKGGIVMKMTIETKKIETGTVDPAQFQLPAGYKEVELEKN